MDPSAENDKIFRSISKVKIGAAVFRLLYSCGCFLKLDPVFIGMKEMTNVVLILAFRAKFAVCLIVSTLTICPASVLGQQVTFQPEPLISVTGKEGSFRGLKFAHHDRELWDCRLNCWNVPEGYSESHKPPVKSTAKWQIFDAAAQGRRMIFVDELGERILSWGGVRPPVTRPLPDRGTVRSIRLIKGDDYFASWLTEPSAIVVGAVRSPKWDRYVSIPDGMKKVFISRSGKLFAAVSPDNDKHVLIWDIKDNQKGAVIEQKSVVASLCVSSDDRFVATGSFDNKVRIYDVESGRQLKVLKGHGKGPIFLGSAVFSVTFSPDVRFLASGGHDGQIIVWDVDSGETVLNASVESKPIVWSVAFSQNSKMVAGGFEGAGPVHGVGVWRLESEK